MGYATIAPDDQKTNYFDSAIINFLKIKAAPVHKVVVNSPEEFESLREDFLRTDATLRSDAKNLLEANFPEQLVLVSGNAKTTAYINAIKQGIKDLYAKSKTYTQLQSTISLMVGPKWSKLISAQAKNYNPFDTLWNLPVPQSFVESQLQQLGAPEKILAVDAFAMTVRDPILDHFSKEVVGRVNSYDFRFKDPVLGHALKIIFKSYFEFLSPEEKMEMLLAVSQKPETLNDPIKALKLIFSRTGPEFQKCFQVVGRNIGFPSDLTEIFKGFEDSLPSASDREVQQILSKIKEKSNLEVVSFEKKPVGVGSVAEVHKGQVKMPNGEITDVAFRFLKPDIKRRAKRENVVIQHVIADLLKDPEILEKAPQLPKAFEQVDSMLEEDLNVDLTEARQKIGQKVYHQKLTGDKNLVVQIDVPQNYWVDGKSGIMISEWVQSESFDAMKKEHPEALAGGVKGWATTWVTEALFGSGFIHADPHPGNLRFQVSDDGSTITVKVLDFGMTGLLNKNIQDRLLVLNMATIAGDDALVAKKILEISTNKPVSEKKLSEELTNHRKVVQARGQHFDIGRVMEKVADLGFDFPGEFAAFARGFGATEMVLKASQGPHLVNLLAKAAFQAKDNRARVWNSLKSISAAERRGLYKNLVTKGFSTAVEACKSAFCDARDKIFKPKPQPKKPSK